MRIEKYKNTTLEEIENKQHNIWIGISLGNGYFTKENIAKYIQWAVTHTKEHVLVLIADYIQAINIEVLDGKNPEAALRRALKMGHSKFNEIREAISFLDEKQKKQIKLVRWNDIAGNDSYYKFALQSVRDEFKNNPIFHDHIINIVVKGRKDRESKITKLNQEELDRLAEYVLQELPYLAGGVVDREGVSYTLFPYPGLNDLDELAIGINNKTIYPELAQKLNIKNNISVIEAYVD